MSRRVPRISVCWLCACALALSACSTPVVSHDPRSSRAKLQRIAQHEHRRDFEAEFFQALLAQGPEVVQFATVRALGRIGGLGATMFLFVTITVIVHGLLIFGGAAALRLDRDMAAVASQANIGGGTSALALARSLGRGDLVLPGILVGSVGTAIGTYLGFLTSEWLL